MRRYHLASGQTLSFVLLLAILMGLSQFGCDGGADTNPGPVVSDPKQIERQHDMKAFMEKEGKNLKAKVDKK
jgi:hypothetical protein